MKPIPKSAWPIVLAFVSLPLAAAESTELERLRDRVVELETRVERLEAGLADTDATLEANKPPEPVPGGWRKAANWRVLEKGMEGWRVREILGAPDRSRQVSKFEYYSYGDEGLVRFYLGRVKSWDLPRGLDPE
jgi:hypothetical protein